MCIYIYIYIYIYTGNSDYDMLHHTMLCYALLYSTLLCSTLLYSTLLYSTRHSPWLTVEATCAVSGPRQNQINQ